MSENRRRALSNSCCLAASFSATSARSLDRTAATSPVVPLWIFSMNSRKESTTAWTTLAATWGSREA